MKAKTISEIRNHIRSDHEQSSFEHIKMNRNNYNEVSEKHFLYDRRRIKQIQLCNIVKGKTP